MESDWALSQFITMTDRMHLELEKNKLMEGKLT
jgi:hypothetical protein